MIKESHNRLMETLEGSHALDILNYSPTKRKVEYHHSLPLSLNKAPTLSKEFLTYQENTFELSKCGFKRGALLFLLYPTGF